MKYDTEWWGVILVAENESDEELLIELHERLPSRAERYYDNGDRSLDRDDEGTLYLMFDR